MTDPLPPRTPLELLPDVSAGQRWIPVQSGESGDAVYRRSDGETYAKLATSTNVARLDGERRRTAWLSAHGLGSPIVRDWIVNDTGACLVTTAVPGVPASDLAADELLRAWPSIARKMAELHALSIADCPFARRLTTMVDLATDVVRRDAVNPDFLAPEDKQTPSTTLLAQLQAEVPMRLVQEANDLVVCHGDACLPNIMVDPKTLQCTGLIDLGRLGIADRYADLSLLLANAHETWATPEDEKKAKALLFDVLAIPAPDDDRLAFYLHLDPLTWG